MGTKSSGSLQERELRKEATILKNDPRSVADENIQRLIQKASSGSFSVTLNKNFLHQLGSAKNSYPTTHYLITGARPVIVSEPAIVIQPVGGESEK